MCCWPRVKPKSPWNRDEDDEIHPEKMNTPNKRHQILKWLDPKPNHYLYRGISTTNQSEGNLFLRSQNISKRHLREKHPPNDFAQQRCGNFIQQGWQPEDGKSGHSGLMLVPKDGEQHQQMYFFLVQQPPKRCRNGLKTWKFVEEIGNILELTSWKRSLASVSGYLYTYYGHDICVFLLTKIWFLIHCQKNYSTLGRLYPLVN